VAVRLGVGVQLVAVREPVEVGRVLVGDGVAEGNVIVGEHVSEKVALIVEVVEIERVRRQLAVIERVCGPVVDVVGEAEGGVMVKLRLEVWVGCERLLLRCRVRVPVPLDDREVVDVYDPV